MRTIRNRGAEMAKRESISRTLLKAVKKSGRTPYSIAKECGTTPEVVSRFLRGSDIRISTADKIAEVLNFELRKRGE